MTELRDPLIEAIHAAGEVPPPPGRDAAFARAMHPALLPSRRRLKGSVVALIAAALLAVPAAVFAARATHTPATIITPITAERPDPGSSIQHEADDSTVKRASESTVADQDTGFVTTTQGLSDNAGRGSAETDHFGDGTSVTPTDGSDGSGSDGSGRRSGGDDLMSTPAPTPIPSPTVSSGDGSPGGPSPTGSPEPSDGGSPGPH